MPMLQVPSRSEAAFGDRLRPPDARGGVWDVRYYRKLKSSLNLSDRAVRVPLQYAAGLQTPAAPVLSLIPI